MYLGFDLGTTNVKATVVDPSGRIVGAGSAPVNRYCTADGGVEQDIEQLWLATCAAIGQAAGKNRDAIRAIGVSSQGGAVQLVDGHQRPLGRVISWLDGRGRPFDLELVAQLGPRFLAEHIGHGGSAMTLGQVLRLRRHAPEALRPPNRLGFVGDVIVGRLCGRRAHDATSLGIALLYNPWLNRADPEILACLGLEETQLPDLLGPTEPAGRLRPEAAERTGLRPGIPVSPAVHDQYAAALGAGSVAPGDVNFGAGTAWVLLANAERLDRPVVDAAFVCPHLVPGVYGQMLSLRTGGSAIEWAMKLIAEERAGLARVDELVDAVPATSDGLRFWPLLPTGARLDRIGLAHGPGHVLRAVIEGLACELARHLGFLRQAGLAPRRLAMCGSASASRTTPQIIADVAGLSVACVDVPDVSALGAAMIASALAGDGPDLAATAHRWSPTGRVLAPRESAAYQELREGYLATLVEGNRGSTA